MKLDNQIILLERLTGKKVVLKEDPDTTMRTLNGQRLYTDTDAFPFYMDNQGNMYVGSTATISSIGKRGALHDEIELVATTSQIDFAPEIREKYKNAPNGREEAKYSGRIWTIGTLISFWEYPETQAKLFEILKKLQIEMKLVNNIDINLSNPIIEVVVNPLTDKLILSHETVNTRDYHPISALIKASNYDACIQGKAPFEKKESR